MQKENIIFFANYGYFKVVLYRQLYNKRRKKQLTCNSEVLIYTIIKYVIVCLWSLLLCISYEYSYTVL